ncbi:hypothetical protein FNF29_06407 [Cafeteria roenbergensis]|uniref:RCC1-like domain-containing protein n=2 Tax=Cafeteria roenbergensis TaxID=33653 RepID=A0A5A8C8J9_CAFRO|nr:hypothetical protein FNF29_06407 [Cafeteria roenbergensis]|eukprot:KAA0148934.1 hypothetical protein FNF29_06407 [Cafeteria roenbergensis]
MVPESPFGLVAELQQRIAIEASAGGYHSLVLLDDGTVRAFGSRQYGQLGYGAAGPLTYELPVAARDAGPVPLGGKAVAVSAGYQHSLVLLEDGTVRAFGAAWSGKLGYGAESTVGGSPDNLPEHAGPVPLGGRALSVSAGDDHSLALLEDRTVRAFGWGLFGQLGYGTKIDIGDTPTTRPVDAGPVPLGGLASSVDAGARHSIVMLEDGTVRAFGIAFDGRLGYGQASDVGDKVTTRPKDMGPVPLGGRAVAASAGGEHSLVLVADGTVRAFGAGNFGQLGYGSTGSVGNTQPTRPDRAGPVPLGGRAVAVSAGGRHSLVMLDDGTVRAFGSVRDGRLGYGMRTDVGSTQATRPADVGPVPLAGRAVAVSAGESHSVVILEDGTVSAFGDGSFVAVSAGYDHSLVLIDDGTVRAFGSGWSGCLGYPSTVQAGDTPATRPEDLGPVPLGGRAVAVSAGGFHSLVLLDDGTVRAFGRGADGQLGYGSASNVGDSETARVDEAGPVPLGGRAVAVDGSLSNAGDTLATRPVAVGPVPLGGWVVAASAGDSHSLVLLEDGTVRAFGSAWNGQLGYGFRVDWANPFRALPADLGPVPLGGGAVAISAGVSHSLVVLEDGTLRAFGQGSDGQLGYGSTSPVGITQTTRPVDAGPVPLGGRVSVVSAGWYHSLVVLEDGTVLAFGEGSDGKLGYGSTEDVGVAPGWMVDTRVAVPPRAVLAQTQGRQACDRPASFPITSMMLAGDSPSLPYPIHSIDARELPDGRAVDGTIASWRVGVDFVPLSEAARAVSCEGLDAPEVWPSPGTVEVVVGGQSTGAVSGVFEGVARPSVQAVSEAVLGPAGLWRAVLHGSALWRSSTAEDVANVTIGSGSGRLGAVAWHDPGAASGTLPGSYLGFDLPRGAAAGARVHVVSSAGLVSTGSVAVSFARISVESAWPDHLLAGEQNATVVLRGRNLALRDSDIDAIRVGGVRCASWRVTQAARAVSCEGLDAPEVWPSPGTVEVVVGGQSTGAVSGVFEGVARPSVQAILVAASGGAVRGAKVLLHGTGFGKRTSSISNVTFGGWPATSFRLLDHSAGLLEATLPAGVGSVQVRVVSATGLDSGALAAPSLLYAAPSVVRCEPPALLAGPKSQSLTIFGTNLGFKVTDVDSVEVEVFEAVPLPELLDASPRVVSPGTLISLQGRYFGKRHQDLAKWTWHGILASLTGSLSVGCTPEGPSSV